MYYFNIEKNHPNDSEIWDWLSTSKVGKIHFCDQTMFDGTWRYYMHDITKEQIVELKLTFIDLEIFKMNGEGHTSPAFIDF